MQIIFVFIKDKTTDKIWLYGHSENGLHKTTDSSKSTHKALYSVLCGHSEIELYKTTNSSSLLPKLSTLCCVWGDPVAISVYKIKVYLTVSLVNLFQNLYSLHILFTLLNIINIYHVFPLGEIKALIYH